MTDYGALDPLQLDLATIVARLEQVKDEGGFEQANPIVVDRIITCDLPRLRWHLSPLAMMLLRAGFPDGRFEQRPDQAAHIRVRLGDDVVMGVSTETIVTLLMGLPGGAAGEWVELLATPEGYRIEARVTAPAEPAPCPCRAKDEQGRPLPDGHWRPAPAPPLD
jgi:hypothetical protein